MSNERKTEAGLAAASGSAFQREYLGVPWTPSPEEKQLRELAREYHERTERFDQIHCKARDKRGIAIPVMPDERSACMKNAMRIRDELGVEAARLGFIPKQWHEAISNAAHEMPNVELCESAGREKASASGEAQCAPSDSQQ